MKTIIKFKVIGLILISVVYTSCKDLTELNINPNGVGVGEVNPNLIMPTVLSEAAKIYLDLGYQNIAGVVQHTQKDAWSSEHNDYDWSGGQNWNSYYDVLRNNELMLRRSEDMGFEFHQGVALVIRAFMFGLIADLWGDAPYTNALKAEQGGVEDILPSFDEQETIYKGIIAELEKANDLLSKPVGDYVGIVNNVDLYYNGNPVRWRRFANSLMLRYYMRLSEKLPDVARAGIEKIATNPSQYPIILGASDDATMAFPGTTADDSWPANTVVDASGSNYRRIKMCATLVEVLQQYNDPRLGIWANRVEVPLVVSATFPAGTDEIVDGKRHLSPDKVGNTQVDTDPDYVGIPPSVNALVSDYNLNPTPGQTSFNPHVSFLNDIYKAASGPLLKARLLSAAEVQFILAEAAFKGWNTGSTAKSHFDNGVKASFDTWTVAANYASYINQPTLAFNNTLQQIIEQKWIASWTGAAEAWFDFRRTGFPNLKAGPAAKRQVLPVRFYYMQDELSINSQNAQQALSRLEKTSYTQADGENSAWSKFWLLQGTGKPW